MGFGALSQDTGTMHNGRGFTVTTATATPSNAVVIVHHGVDRLGGCGGGHGRTLVKGLTIERTATSTSSTAGSGRPPQCWLAESKSCLIVGLWLIGTTATCSSSGFTALFVFDQLDKAFE